jgi:hypothetical protein
MKEAVYLERDNHVLTQIRAKCFILTKRGNLSDLHTGTVTATVVTGKNGTSFVGNM